jgi:pantoate--beta-alanine ligase
MKIIRSSKQLQRILQKERARGKSIGFVPTMGTLHKGHLSLVRASARENNITVVSIFVNPTQFGPKEDYKKYPRVLGADIKKLRTTKTDYLFLPSVADIYPKDCATFVEVSPKLTGVLCGKFRPGHFRGVATVVTKLLNVIGLCRLYLGAKDYQQAAVVGRLVQDLKIDCRVRMMPTVREADGLAMSSRNRYLSPHERRRALAISRVLMALKRDILKKQGTLAKLKTSAIKELKKSVDRLQYLEIVDPVTLEPVKKYQSEMVALTACFVGKTRLIDNVIIHGN